MEIKKMSLDNIQGVMSRKELKNVMAGSGIVSGSSVPCPKEGTYTPCDEKTVCKTAEHPNSYCATTVCTTSGGTSSSFKSCNYYA